MEELVRAVEGGRWGVVHLTNVPSFDECPRNRRTDSQPRDDPRERLPRVANRQAMAKMPVQLQSRIVGPGAGLVEPLCEVP